jgi:hypothetical protein
MKSHFQFYILYTIVHRTCLSLFSFSPAPEETRNRPPFVFSSLDYHQNNKKSTHKPQKHHQQTVITTTNIPEIEQRANRVDDIDEDRRSDASTSSALAIARAIVQPASKILCPHNIVFSFCRSVASSDCVCLSVVGVELPAELDLRGFLRPLLGESVIIAIRSAAGSAPERKR